MRTALVTDAITRDHSKAMATCVEPDPVARLRRIAAEATLLQDDAAELLDEIAARGPLAELASRGGRITTRFVTLAEELPASADPLLRRYCEVLHCVFDHHAMLIASALDLLAVDWRSEAMVEQLGRIGGLGPPAEWLEAIRAQLEDRYADTTA
ncbi:MAG TPA: hypothetical protein VH276_12195 [Solirubrobacteraceae bacterium]|nr:hypothetical protein [Solirubrobacteraceae bacterium]